MTTRKRLFVRSLDQGDATRGFLANPVAPRIPDAVVYGGIARANVFPLPGRGTVVAVDALNLIEGDQVTLYWHDPVTPVASRAVPPNLNTSLIFDVPADVLRRFPPFPPEGPVTGDNVQVEVWYTIYRAFPEELFTSDKAIVTVDWLVPGDPDPDPTTPYVNENLAPMAIPAPVPTGQDLILSIPRWKNAARGDRLTIAWGATQFLVATLADSLGAAGPALIATVPWIVIDNAGDNIVATYYVLDAVSNHSLWAPSVVPDVETGDRLPAPTILGLNDYDELDADALAGGDASVEVRYPGPLAGDRVALTWTGQTREGIPLPEFTLDATLPTPPTAKHTFKIPYSQIVPLIEGRARVSYTTVPAGGTPVRRSSSATADVVGTAISLPAPTVREATAGTLDPAGTATVVVSTDYSFVGQSDRITALWQGRSSAGAIVIEQQDKLASDAVASELEFVIPHDKLAAIAGGTVEVSYTVRTGGNVVVPSAVLALSIDELEEAELTLMPPSVDGAAGGVLDIVDIGAVVIVRVPANAAFQARDMVDVAWFGTPGDGTYIGNSAKPAAPAGISFEVPRSVVLTNTGTRVTVRYAFVRDGNSRLSDARVLDIVNSGSLPEPSVDQAASGELDPLGLPNGFTVRVPLDADLVASDSVTATLTGSTGQDFTSASQPGATAMTFTVPAAALASHLARPISVYYTRTRNGTSAASDVLVLGVRGIASGDSRLPTPTIAQANGAVLDLSTFTGDPLIIVAPWPLIVLGQPISVSFRIDPAPWELRSKGPVDATELTAGLRVPLPRGYLDRYEDGAQMQVLATAYFDGNQGVAFPTYAVTLRKETGIDLPVPQVPQANGAELDGGLDTATLRVPAGVPLKVGDTVYGDFNATGLGSKTVTVPGAAIDLTIPTAVIASARGKDVVTFYTVLRSGPPLTSPSLHLSVSDPLPGNLAAPTIPQATSGELDGGLASATLRVPPDAVLKAGDIIQGFFDGSSIGTSSVTTPGSAMDLAIPTAAIVAARGRNTTAYYTVTRAGNVRTSASLNLRVSDPVPASMPAPDVPEEIGGELDGSLARARLHVVASAPLKVGDSVEGFFDGKSIGSRGVTSPGTTLSLEIPGTAITSARGRQVTVYYTVTRASYTTTSSSLSLRVSDPVPALDFGGPQTLYCVGYVVAEGRPPMNPPTMATYTRTATGGTPPFTYRSTQPIVATIDAAGRVKACSNGTTTLTATDSNGQSASHVLTVTGAKVWRHRPSWGLVTFAEQTGVSNSEGDLDRLASSRAEIQELRNVYLPEGNPATVLGWLPNYMFTSEPASTNNYYWGKEIGSGNEDQCHSTTRCAMLALVRSK